MEVLLRYSSPDVTKLSCRLIYGRTAFFSFLHLKKYVEQFKLLVFSMNLLVDAQRTVCIHGASSRSQLNIKTKFFPSVILWYFCYRRFVIMFIKYVIHITSVRQLYNVHKYYKENFSIEMGGFFFILISMLKEKNAGIFVYGEKFLTKKSVNIKRKLGYLILKKDGNFEIQYISCLFSRCICVYSANVLKL